MALKNIYSLFYGIAKILFFYNNIDYRGHSSLFVKNNLDLMCEEYHSSSRPKLDLAEIIRITMLV